MRRHADGGRQHSAVPAVGPRSWWLDEALRADPGEPCPALIGEVTADVCVVGGGFAGLWTAYELHERDPALGIVLVEADIVGAGGSGANGGFFSPSWTQLSGLCASLGEEGGVTYAAALAAMVDELDGWVERHDARIDAWHEGILYARAGEWQPGPDDETFRLLEKHGYADRLRRVDAAEARAVADSPRFVGGVMTPDLTVLQPGKLARELRRVLLERGVRIFEGTPMLRVEAGRPPRVVTPAGVVSAGNVVLTHGAWAARERHFRRAFAVCTDFMVVTEPIPELIEQIGWTSHMGVADLREMLYYLRRTADDRIAIGGGAMGIVPGARIRGRVLTSPAAGGDGRARPHLAVPAARGRALRRRLERADGHHRRGAAVLRVGAGRPHARRPRLLRPRPHEHQARRQDPGFAGARTPTTSGAACRSSARRSRSSRRSRCAGRSCSPRRGPTRPVTARTSRAGAPACCLAR